MKPAAETNPLVFQWPEKRRPLLVLLWFVLLSFGVHALAFYIFQVTYPSTVSIAPPPVQVSLLSPSTPEYRTLIRWIEAGNPALVMSPPDTTPPGILQSSYKPSYLAVRALPKPAKENDEPVRFPPATTLRTSVASTPPPPVQSASPRLSQQGASSLRASGALANRKIKTAAEIRPGERISTPLKPSRFLAGVDDRGDVRYLFLEESCGNKTLDQWAERHLSKITFAPDSQNITWGMVSYFWGDDTYETAR